MKEFRGRGYAQQAIQLAEEDHGSSGWKLDTILQEKGNCHLYEKLGYRQTGETKVVNERMTLVFYQKNNDCMKLYIDIDGVLLKLRDPHPADYAEEFISYIVEHFDCYWLTTHCKGDTSPTIEYLSEYFPDIVIEKLKCIKPTMWGALKTDAIDFSSEFIWLDDYIMNAELAVLKENGCADSVYRIDLE